MKKVIITVFLIIFLFTIYEISSTYGLFETNNTIVVNEDIGRFNIVVNDTSIGGNTSFEVNNFVVSTTSTVREGKFYPGATGYFDIIIDPSECDVSLRYDILVDNLGLINDKFSITSIEEINGNSLILTDENTYSGVITLDEIRDTTLHTIRVSLSWENDENNNYTDSIWGVDGVGVSIPVNVHLIQYLGEDLEVYTD